MQTKKIKKIIFIYLILVLVFIAFHGVIWKIYTQKIYGVKNNIHIGGLARMSYYNDSLYPRQDIQDLPKKHFNLDKIQQVDVITLGDSFSKGGGGGRNKYYQDYIASKYNAKVLNIQNLNTGAGYIDTLVALANSKLIDKLQPKIIILESVERGAIFRYAQDNINWETSLPEYELIKQITIKAKPPKQKYTFINNINYNALLYNWLYKYDDNAYYSKCYITELTQDLFSVKASNKLLFYYEDIELARVSNKQEISKLNNNLNKLQELLAKKNIQLYFMPAVDKYNLYSKFIIDNKYPESIFFELLRQKTKSYKLIDTKQILLAELEKNTKDVYYADDTHWSNRASEIIFSQVILKELF